MRALALIILTLLVCGLLTACLLYILSWNDVLNGTQEQMQFLRSAGAFTLIIIIGILIRKKSRQGR